jgi:hypothetical protein
MRRTFVALAVTLVAGCSNRFDSAIVKVRYQPPRGASLLEEQAGPPAVARFSSGLEIRSVQGAPPDVDEARLDALYPLVASKAGLAVEGALASARSGRIPAGSVVRFAVKGGGSRSVVYFLPAARRFLVLSLTSPEARAAAQETGFERSLGTLRLRD